MPRIDPLKLLDCLSVLLAPNGGIKSAQEVKRIACLMQKFSKKLVSKCIYIQILKCSETELLGQFMETGGWQMTHPWLQDAIESDNWPLVQEVLELFLLCPVDVARLRSNSAPKLVKNLSKEAKHEGVKILSSRLVEQWLKLVKGEAVTFAMQQQHQLTSPEQMLLDPSLAIEGDELNGLGGSADIDVDEIIPTLSHHHPTNSVDVGQGTTSFLTANNHDETLGPGMEVDHQGEQQPRSSVAEFEEKGDGSNKSSSCNVKETNESVEKDNLKIKITMKDGKTKVTTGGSSSSSSSSSAKKEKDEKSSSSSSRAKESGEKKSSSSSSSSSGDKERKSSSSSKSSSSHHKSSSSSKRSSSSSKSGSSSSRDKERHGSSSSHRSSHSSSKSSSSSSSSSRREKEKEQADKDKDTLTKVMGSGALEKLGKIPKKVKSEEATTAAPPAKKSSISIEVRKDPENRPKTVKTFNSQFRDHGLVEDIPPPPSRKTLKKPAAVAPTTGVATTFGAAIKAAEGTSLKRTSPTKDPTSISPVSEKRLKLEQIVTAAASPTEEKAGGIKLIAARSKPTLIESDMFMDALCSSAAPTTKANAKKRKRLPSTSKDGSPPPPESPKITAAPMKFYQDTMENSSENAKDEESPAKKVTTTEGEDNEDEENSKEATTVDTPSSPTTNTTTASGDKVEAAEKEGGKPNGPESPGGSDPASPGPSADQEMEMDEENATPKPPGPGCGPNGPPGVLVIHRRRGTKKSVRWRPQEMLEEVRLFELDETERVNVTKTFTDMKQMERFGERDAFQMARKLQSEDVMVEQTPWTHLIEVDDVPEPPGGNQSKERDVQAARELTCLQALYFNYTMVPDSSSEPEAETYKYAEPAVIPLEDAQNTVNDFTKQGWPEPKEALGNGPFNGGAFDPSAFGPGPFNMPPFGGPNPSLWGGPTFGGGVPNGIAPFGGALNNEEIKLTMNRLAFPGQTFNPPNFNGIAMMSLPAMAGGGPMGPGPGHGPPPGNGGPPGNWGFRGPPPPAMGGVWRGHGPPNGPPPGRREWMNNNNGGGMIGRPCKNFKKGFCKKGDSCNFSHATGGPPGGFNRI